MNGDAVLLMAYGSPDRLDQVEAYYTDIRRGSPPPPELLDELVERYRSIGGGSPLSRIVEAQRAAVEAELVARDTPTPVYAGMRHVEPRIGDVVRRMAADGVRRFAAVALAPQASSNGVGYRRAVDAALESLGDGAPAVVHVPAWHDEPRFIEALARTVCEAYGRFEDPSAIRVMFTAHSLPARVLAEGDPYPDQLAATASLVAQRLGLDRYEFAFQSAGRTAEPWLGPDLLDAIRSIAGQGVAALIVRPVGFVADHLEVLYDIDIEAQAVAREAGVELVRARSLNTDPTFIAGLANVAAAALRPVAAG